MPTVPGSDPAATNAPPRTTRPRHARRRVPPRRYLAWAALAGLALLVVLATWPWLASSRVPGATGSTAGQRAGQQAPDFRVATLDGTSFALSAQRGKPVVLFFMAGWCISCVAEAQALAQLQQDYADRGLQVLAIDVDAGETAADLDRFRQLVPGAAYHWALDPGNRVTLAYGVRAMDTTVVIDGAGRIAYRDEAPSSYARLRQALERALP
jgi:peroxiredoxin